MNRANFLSQSTTGWLALLVLLSLPICCTAQEKADSQTQAAKEDVKIDEQLLENLLELMDRGAFVTYSRGDSSVDSLNRISLQRIRRDQPDFSTRDLIRRVLTSLDAKSRNIRPFTQAPKLLVDFNSWQGSDRDWTLLKKIDRPFTFAGAEFLNEEKLEFLAETNCEALIYSWYSNPSRPNRKVTKADFQRIARNTKLRSLSLTYCDFDPKDLLWLMGSSIVELEFGHPVDQRILNAVSNLDQIVMLRFGYGINCENQLPDFRCFQKLKRLEALSIFDSSLPVQSLRQFRAIASLKSLRFPANDTHLKAIVELQQISTLFGGTFSDRAIDTIEKMPNLSAIKMNANFSDESLDRIEKLANLKWVVLEDTISTIERAKSFVLNNSPERTFYLRTLAEFEEFPAEALLQLCQNGATVRRENLLPGAPFKVMLRHRAWKGTAADLRSLQELTPLHLTIRIKLTPEDASELLRLPQTTQITNYVVQDESILRKLKARFSIK